MNTKAGYALRHGLAGFAAMVFLCVAWVCGCTPSTVRSPYSGDFSSGQSGGDAVSPGFQAHGGTRALQVVGNPLSTVSSSAPIVHEVGPMETIWRISKMYGVSIETICRANGITPNDALKIGQKLNIPQAKGFRNIVTLYPSSKWTYIIVHHTATEIGKASLINQAHNDRGFWQGLGYHFLIDNGTLGKGDGQIEASPRWIKQEDGAHCKAGGMNFKGIGVALVGNFDHDTPTAKQIQSLGYLVGTLMSYYRIPPANVMGHRDVPGASTDCPGKLFPWSTVRQSIASYYRVVDAGPVGR